LGNIVSIAYVVLGIPILVFSIVVLFDIGRWSAAKDVMSGPWRLALGLLWLATGCGLLLAAALQKTTFLVWTPGVVGVVIFFYFLSKSRQEVG
jgi:hypothetical protein